MTCELTSNHISLLTCPPCQSSSLIWNVVQVLQVIVGSPTQLQQPDESSKERPTPPSKLSITAEGSQYCEEEVDSDKPTKMDGLDVTLWKEKRFTPQWSRAGAVEQCVPASGPQHRQKRCRVCQRNTVKQLESIEETHFYGMARNSNRFTNLQHQQNNESDRYLWNSEQQMGSLYESKSEKGRQIRAFVNNLDGIGDTDISSDRMVSDISKMSNSDIEATSKPEEVDWLSKEASKAIKQIELCISAFHMDTDHLHLFEKNSAQPHNSVPETKSAGAAMRMQSGGMSLGEQNFTSRSNLLCGVSSQRVVDRVGYPSVTAEERKQPYLSLSQTAKLVQPTSNIIRRGPALQSDASGESGESIDECKFATKKVNKIYGQNVKAIIDKIESGNWIMSRNGFAATRTHNVKNFSVAVDPSETSYRTPCSSASKMESPYHSHMAMEDERSRCKLFQTYKPSGSFMNLSNTENIQSVDSCLNGISTFGARGKNHPPKIMGETLINKKPSQLLVSNQSDAQHKGGIPKNRHYITASRTCLQHQESDGTATDSSSDWRSQQTSSRDSDNDSEEYSLTDETQYVTSSRSSGSWASPLSHGTRSQHSSYTGNSEEEVCSSSSGEGAREVTSSSSSKSEGYSSYQQPIRSYARPPTYMSKQSTPKKSGPSRIRKAYGINHKKQSGMWKRLKDRLAIVFHHHHHHHHHNHGPEKMSRNTALNRRKGKVINFKRQDEAYGEKAVEKMRKSPIHEKMQQTNFLGLMEGLLRHVRHSKQSKPGKGTAGQLAKEQHGKKKTLNKSHWWQLLQHHRGAKLPNKTHVTLGLAKKKARLKALPNIK